MESKGELKKLKYKILGHTWTIEFVAKDDPRINNKAYGKSCFGYCSGDTREIFVGLYQKNVIENTLTHELTHAYMDDTLHYPSKKYDAEFIAEFCASYAEQIVEDTKKILKLKGEN